MDEQAFKQLLPALVARYRPSPEVHQQLSKITMIAVVGPTSVGKTTLIQNSGIPLVISDATRARRPNEVDGVDNFFRHDYDAIVDEIKNGEFVQIAIGSEGDFKGTKLSSYPDSGPAAAPITAASLSNLYSLGFKKVIPVFVIPPSYDEWKQRTELRRQSESAELFANRLAEAKQSFELALADDRYAFLISDDLQTVRDDFLEAIDGTYPVQKNLEARALVQLIADHLTNDK